jgi:hypothetical protein
LAAFARREYNYYGADRLSDLNGDKVPDVIAYAGDGVGTLLGNGNGAFRDGPVSNIGMNGSFALADLNGDGVADLVIAGRLFADGPGASAFRSATPAAPSSPRSSTRRGPTPTLSSVVFGDFNGDGIPDAVSGRRGRHLALPVKAAGTAFSALASYSNEQGWAIER